MSESHPPDASGLIGGSSGGVDNDDLLAEFNAAAEEHGGVNLAMVRALRAQGPPLGPTVECKPGREPFPRIFLFQVLCRERKTVSGLAACAGVS